MTCPCARGIFKVFFSLGVFSSLTLNTKKPMVLPARCSSYSLSHDWTTFATALREYVLYVLCEGWWKLRSFNWNLAMWRRKEWHEHGAGLYRHVSAQGAIQVDWSFRWKKSGNLKWKSEVTVKRASKPGFRLWIPGRGRQGMVAGGFELEMQRGGSTLALEFNLCDFFLNKVEIFPIKSSCRLNYIAYVKQLCDMWMVNEFGKLVVPFP